MRARARSTASGARTGQQASRAYGARQPVPSRPVAPSLQIALAPLAEFTPLAPATTPVELMKAVLHRVAARFTDHALATYEDGRPCLPEMERAAHWSGWGAWFIETTRAGDAVAVRDRLDGEKVLAVAFERRRKLVGFPKNRYLTQAETVAAVREALAYVEKWGRS